MGGRSERMVGRSGRAGLEGRREGEEERDQYIFGEGNPTHTPHTPNTVKRVTSDE